MNAIDRSLLTTARHIGANVIDRKVKKKIPSKILTSSLSSSNLTSVSTKSIPKTGKRLNSPIESPASRAFHTTITSKTPKAKVKKGYQQLAPDEAPNYIRPSSPGLKGKRTRIPYEANVSIARACETPHNALECTGAAAITQDAIDSSEECRVKDHAQRRLQLFYYLLVAYYNEGCEVKLDKTVLQHGFSSCPHFNAAHSSILPDVSDDLFERLADNLIENGVDREIKQFLLCLGANKKSISEADLKNFSKTDWRQLFRSLGIKGDLKLISSGCHFYHNQNATVEVPVLVNRYDALIETAMRSIALEIVNRVSRGGLTPYKGLEEFEIRLKEFFEESKKETSAKIRLLKDVKRYEATLWNLEHSLKKGMVSDETKWVERYMTALNLLQESIDSLAKKSFCHSFSIKREMSSPNHLIFLTRMKLYKDEINFQHLSKRVQKIPHWSPSSIEEDVRLLENALQIIDWQEAASVAFPYELLSGIPVDGERRPMSKKELYAQKLEIISRK